MKLFLRTALFLFLLCFCKSTEIQAKVLESGTCGAGTAWDFSENGELNIHGNGAIVSSPWKGRDWWRTDPYKSDEEDDAPYEGIYVKRIVVGEGITSIGDYAFSSGGYSAIQLPESLTSISICAFEDCPSLKKLLIPDQVTDMEKDAFRDCGTLQTVQLPKQLKRSCGAPSFEGNYGLRKVINHSCLTLPVDTQEGNLTWKVNGKTVKKVAAGKTARIIPKKFRIRYKMNGAVLKGRKITSYEFGDIVNLPASVTKKGYIFYGWDYSSDYFTEDVPDFSEDMPAYGDVTVTPQFIRFQLRQDKKRTVRATVDSSKARNSIEDVVIRYFTNPKKKNTAPYKCRYSSSKNITTLVFPKLKRGQRYYFEVCFPNTDSDWEEDEKSYWMPRRIWYPMGSVKIRVTNP